MKSYIYMIKIKILLSLAYKSEIYIRFISYVILLFSTVYFWKAAFKGIENVAGINEQQILIYTVMSLMIRNWHSISVEDNIRNQIRMGNIAVDLIKPINIFGMYFSEDIVQTVTSILQSTLPILICSILFIVKPIPASILHFILFIISFSLGYLILWLISALFGLLYFQFIDLGPLSDIKNSILSILSGSFVPIWFFPKGFQDVSQYLPFIYIYQHPIGIYIGKYSIYESMQGCLIQTIWLVLLWTIFYKMHKRIEAAILIQGG